MKKIIVALALLVALALQAAPALADPWASEYLPSPINITWE